MITSTSNQGLKRIGNLLAKKKERDLEGVYVCEGRKMFFEILRQEPELLERIYIAESAYEALSTEEQVELAAVSFELVLDSVFDKVANTVTPQGFLAVVKRKNYTLEQFLPTSDGKMRLILLETLQDPGNLGTILRTAEAAGMDGILLSSDSVDVYNPKVVRSTMGAINRVPILYVEDLHGAMRELQSRGMKLFAAALDGSIEYQTADYGESYGILIGNEANGLKPETADAADVRVRIPMEGQVESLNAAVACAIICYRARYS